MVTDPVVAMAVPNADDFQILMQRLMTVEQQLFDTTNELREVRAREQTARSQNSQSSNRLTVDARQLQKPDIFEGEDKKWKDWSLIFKSYAGLANPDIPAIMKKAEYGEPCR